MKISVLANDLDSKPKSQEGTWSDLKEMLAVSNEVDCPKTTIVKGDKIPVKVCSSLHVMPDGSRPPNKCPARKIEAWSPAIFDGVPDAKGGWRTAKHVVGMDVLVFDVDHATLAELTALDAAIEREGYRAILHSTHSHNPAQDDYCVRVIFECARTLTPSEIVPTREALQRTLGFRADEQTKDPSRLYYVPSRPKGGPDYLFSSVEGRAVEPVPASAAVTPIRVTPPAAELAEPIEMDPIRARIRRAAKGNNADILRRVLTGEKLADAGGRDNAVNSASSVLAFLLPDVPVEALLEVMRPSLLAMDPPESGSWSAIALDKLQRARERSDTKIEHTRAAVAVAGRVFNKASALAMPDIEDPKNSDPFDASRIEQWASENGCADDLDRFNKQWIIRYHGANWVFVNGAYMSAVPDEDLRQSLLRDLSRAPVRLKDEDKHGHQSTRPIGAILDDYATTARKVQASLALNKSYYDPVEQCFHEALCPVRRSLRPVHDPEILEWLEMFGGDVLLDWVACVTLLNMPAAALYIQGPPGTGKNVLADGLARLWHKGGASDFKNVVGSQFNDSLTRCPLVFADEGIPKTEGILDDLRKIIGARERPLNRKFMPAVNLEGYPRLLITANNERVLQETGATLGADDISAVAQRIRIIETTMQPVDHLAHIRNTRGMDYIEGWVTGDRVAQCALWLRDNRQVSRQTRFLVSSNDPTLSEEIATGTKSVSAMLEFLARYLSDTTKIESPRVRFGDGRLLVNTELMADKHMWERYVPSRKILSALEVSKNLRSISESKPVSYEGLEYHNVKPHILINWARKEQVGSATLIEKRIKGS